MGIGAVGCTYGMLRDNPRALPSLRHPPWKIRGRGRMEDYLEVYL
jgi:hypothetical protein